MYPLVDSDMLEWGSHCISFVDGKLTDGRLTSDSRHQELRNEDETERSFVSNKYFGNNWEGSCVTFSPTRKTGAMVSVMRRNFDVSVTGRV